MIRYACVAVGLLTAHAAWALPPASHAYGLDKNFADELGGPPIAPVLGKVKLTRCDFPTGGGAALTGAVDAHTYSIELRFRLTFTGSTDTAYRVLDFKALGSDLGLYAYTNGILQFYQGHFDNPQGPPGVILPGTYADVLITRDGASNVVAVYAKGKLQFSFVDTAGDAVFATPDGVHTQAGFFVDNNGENGSGSLDHLRVFPTVLTAANAGALAHGKLPPNVTLK